MKTITPISTSNISSVETNLTSRPLPRRSFLRRLGLGAVLLSPGAGLLVAEAQARDNNASANRRRRDGDIAILRFLAAAEILETDLWQQYNELGGIQDDEVPGGSGNETYTEKLENLDDDMPDYIHDNTDDEMSHVAFINAYLMSKGAQALNLDQFRTLPGSTATGSSGQMRLTNLMQLRVDTTWYTRYRSDDGNPDFGDTFPPAVPGLSSGNFPSIPRSDADLAPDDHIQAIANTAAFHFAAIEQGGTSLYAALAQRVNNAEVLRVLLSIGGSEIAHFQTWHDKAGAAVSSPNAPLVDSTNGLTFPDLNSPPFGGDEFETGLIMPEPCPFLSRAFPTCSIIRPTETNGAAMAAVRGLTDSGLFAGQSPAFFQQLNALATAADAAQRQR
jgi:Ferritin-like domain